MPEALRIELRRRPSTVGNMTRALYPSASLAKAGRFPPIVVSWTRHQVDRRQLDTFLGLTRLVANGRDPRAWHLLPRHVRAK